MLLFVGGFVTAALQIGQVKLGAGFETLAIARNLARYGEFANPFQPMPTGPTALCPPLYPSFMALLIRMFGDTLLFAVLLSVITMVVHGLHAAVLPSVSALFLSDTRPGIYGACVSILLPLLPLYPQHEMMYAALGTMYFCLASAWLARRGGVLAGLGTGAFGGLLLLLNPATLFITGPWIAYMVWRRIPCVVRFASVGMLTALLVLLPWTWRNYRIFHKLFFVRDNIGLELLIGNNDLAQPTFLQNGQSHQLMHPNWSLARAAEVLRMGEVRFSDRCLADARQWIRQHPSRFGALTVARVRMFWFPDSDAVSRSSRWFGWNTVICVAGLTVMAWRRQRIAVYLAFVLLLYPMLYYIVQYDARYRVPVLWIMLLGSGYFVAGVMAQLQRGLSWRLRPIKSTSVSVGK
jgi:hypothetical protein